MNTENKEAEAMDVLRWFIAELADDSVIDMAKLINELEKKSRAVIFKTEEPTP